MMLGSPPMTEYLWGVADLNYKDEKPFYSYPPVWDREQDVHRDLTTLVTGKGLKHDHPLVAKTIMESFKHMPKLARLYATGR